MVEGHVERKLAAIFAGDVAGYSRLMGVDEEGTLHQLKTHRKELVDPKITEHRGHIVKTTGDGMLVEFISVVDAVRCAVDIQRGMAERNVEIPADRRIEFRIGINVGDIISDENDIYGDGVNVAARLETLAEPGGILVSRNVHDQVRDKLSFGFEDLGEQSVKNIARPIGVHRVSLVESAAEATVKSMAAAKPKLAASQRPSIAVLPFANMSGDPEQEYFADGISEDIITGLSKLRWFFVIARNSSFIYKGKAVDVKHVAHELGVRYVLEGSVRKSGNRVRITTQLIDAPTSNHIWADRYDGDLTDIFALQDEITEKVVAAIEPKLLEAEGIRSQNRSPDDLGAWDMVIQANSLFWRLTKVETEAAIDVLRQAAERYPNYGPAHSILAFVLLISGYLGWSVLELQLQEATRLATRAAQLDDSDPWAHLALGFVAFVRRQTNVAAAEFRRALELNPNFAAAHGYLGWTLAFDGQSGEAARHLEEAIRMSPHDPQNAIFNTGLAVTNYLEERYAKAVEYSSKTLQQRSAFTAGHRIHVASLAQNGQIDEAREALARLKEMHPGLSISWIEKNVPYTSRPMAKFVEGMRKAGLQ
ncbi:MAG TPA: adenylate/guanylate cyclase domain-containing protein [Terriglobales bacterium]|nr:adenylate/guanylate cyclase domain-containing protein [Terriglobales bacterium]